MRLIDADALRNKLENLADDEWNRSTTTSWAEAFTECADMVEDAPTIEPEERTEKRTETHACDYERAVEQLEHDMLYEPTFNQDDGSM